jgi:hypothetical protein
MNRIAAAGAAVVVGALIASSSGARAADPAPTFEKLAEGAAPLANIDSLVWAMTASCSAGDDLAQRQCRLVRDAAVKELTSKPLLVDVDDAFTVGAWDVNKKSVPMSLVGCLACDGVALDGTTWHVTGSLDGSYSSGPKVGKDGPRGGVLHETARTFRDDAAAVAWQTSVGGRLRTQLLVTVPGSPTWTNNGLRGITVKILGYRVYDPCDGSIVSSLPTAGPGPMSKSACAEKPAAEGGTIGGPAPEKLPEKLTAPMVTAAMLPAKAAAMACYEDYGVTGEASLKLGVSGEGQVFSVEQKGDFVGTPTGECIDAAVRKLTFPRTKTAKAWLTYPILIRPE